MFMQNLIEFDSLITKTLSQMDDGELFGEKLILESLVFDDGKLKNSSYNISGGFGLRAIIGEQTAYAHSSIINRSMVQNAAEFVSQIKNGYQGEVSLYQAPIGEKSSLYEGFNPVNDYSLAQKIELLGKIDVYLREKNPLVKQATISLVSSYQEIIVIKPGFVVEDFRPLTRLNISVIVENNGKRESGSYGLGGREKVSHYIEKWQYAADQALAQALVNLEAKPTPAGEMKVVLGSGWPGILLHEAVGHGLEGDFFRKKTSVYSEMIGKRVASKGVTVIDDGTIPGRRGSINIDDEGTKPEKTVLIEDGILLGFMQDRLNARLTGNKPTGNGRRESYAHQPMPRMTNTYMLNGNTSHDEIIKSIDRGIYAKNFSGGQVDITSGRFVFSASESYMIENGKITYPVKGATLIGTGKDAMNKITAIADNMELDPGIGTCGKAGQSVPVGVGQPTILIDKITVGGTA